MYVSEFHSTAENPINLLPIIFFLFLAEILEVNSSRPSTIEAIGDDKGRNIFEEHFLGIA